MKNKLVTNLLENIGKARDLLEQGDLNEIYKRVQLFWQIENDLSVQLGKFTKDKNYELDFNFEDLNALSEELYNFLKHYPAQFRYKNYIEDMKRLKYIDVAVLNKYSDELAIKYKVDTYLRSCQKVVCYFALVVDLYSNSNERKEVEEKRKDFTLALTEHIRSFL